MSFLKKAMSLKSPVEKNEELTTSGIGREIDPNEIIYKEGELSKQGDTVKFWRTRRFVLKRTALTYFAGSSKKGEILLEGHNVGVFDHSQFMFTMTPVTGIGRTFYFQAKTETEMMAWVRVIKERIEAIKHGEKKEYQIDFPGIDNGPPPPKRVAPPEEFSSPQNSAEKSPKQSPERSSFKREEHDRGSGLTYSKSFGASPRTGDIVSPQQQQSPFFNQPQDTNKKTSYRASMPVPPQQQQQQQHHHHYHQAAPLKREPIPVLPQGKPPATNPQTPTPLSPPPSQKGQSSDEIEQTKEKEQETLPQQPQEESLLPDEHGEDDDVDDVEDQKDKEITSSSPPWVDNLDEIL